MHASYHRDITTYKNITAYVNVLEGIPRGVHIGLYICDAMCELENIMCVHARVCVCMYSVCACMA